MHSKSYKSVAAASWRRNDCEGGRVVCAAETPSLTVGLLSQARTLTLAVLILNGLALPGGEAARESLGERLRLPARGERAQRARVGAPVLRVSGARAASAANLFAGRDQRAHPFGEFDDARLLAARHVDDGEAPAVAPAREGKMMSGRAPERRTESSTLAHVRTAARRSSSGVLKDAPTEAVPAAWSSKSGANVPTVSERSELDTSACA